MDVCSLFPNCKLKECRGYILEALECGLLAYEDVDVLFMLKFLALTEGNPGGELEEFVPTPKGTTTLHSLLKNDNVGQFYGAQRSHSLMTQQQIRKAVGRTIGQALQVTYRNHNYTVGGEIHRQSDGGPQGLSTAVEGSETYMLGFDRKFLKRLE